MRLGLALTLGLLAPAATASDFVTIQGCPRPGVEAGCVVIESDGRLWDVTAAEPKPQIGSPVSVTGVPSGGVSICQQGIVLKPATSEPIKGASCPGGG